MRVKRKVVAGGALVVLIAALLLLLSTTSQNATITTDDPHLELQVLELQKKLHKADSLNRQREDQMYALLASVDSVGNASARMNGSSIQDVMAGLQVPGIYSSLPHLTGHPEFLRPAIKLSKGRQEGFIRVLKPEIVGRQSSCLELRRSIEVVLTLHLWSPSVLGGLKERYSAYVV